MKKTILLSLIAVFLFTACSRKMVKWSGYQEEFKQWKKVALVQLMICPSQTPSIPLIDAGIYNSSFEDIIIEIQKLHEQKAYDVHLYLGDIMKKYTKMEVLYGRDLFADMKYKELKNSVKVYDPILDNDDFITFAIPEDTYNFIDFSEESTPEGYIDNAVVKEYQETFKKLCEKLEVDGIVLGTISVNTYDVGIFGAYGSREMNLRLYFLNKDGKMTLLGKARSEGTSGDSDDMFDYKENFDAYYEYTEKLFKKLYGLPFEE